MMRFAFGGVLLALPLLAHGVPPVTTRVTPGLLAPDAVPACRSPVTAPSNIAITIGSKVDGSEIRVVISGALAAPGQPLVEINSAGQGLQAQ